MSEDTRTAAEKVADALHVLCYRAKTVPEDARARVAAVLEELCGAANAAPEDAAAGARVLARLRAMYPEHFADHVLCPLSSVMTHLLRCRAVVTAASVVVPRGDGRCLKVPLPEAVRAAVAAFDRPWKRTESA